MTEKVATENESKTNIDLDTDPELVSTLEQLKYLHFPEDSLWWPPAPATLVVLLFITCIFGVFIKTLIKKASVFCQSRPAKLAFKQLKEIQCDNTDILSNNILIIQKINILLKKCAILKFSQNSSYYAPKSKQTNPYINIESLSGNDWLEFLNFTGETNLFTKGDGQILNLAYQSQCSSDQNLQDKIENLIALTEQWIKKNI